MLRFLPLPLRVFWLALREHLETSFHQHEVLHLAGGRARIEDQRILSGLRALRVIAIQQPLTAVDGGLLIRHTRGHVDAVRDAMRISNDQAWAVVGFGLEERL